MYRPSTVRAGYGLEVSLIHDYITVILLLHMSDKDYLMKLNGLHNKAMGFRSFMLSDRNPYNHFENELK